jgi:hypothetical protein
VLALYRVYLVVKGAAGLESSEGLLVERVYDGRASCGRFAVGVCFAQLLLVCALHITTLQRTLRIALFPVAGLCWFGRSLLDLESEFLILDFDNVLQGAAAQDAGLGVHGACCYGGQSGAARVGKLRRMWYPPFRAPFAAMMQTDCHSGLSRAECVGGDLNGVFVPLLLENNIAKCEIAFADGL